MNVRLNTSPPVDRPARPFLSVFLPTALTLAAALLVGTWLLRDGSSSHRVTTPAIQQQSAAVPQQLISGTEKGDLTKLQNDLGRAQIAAPPPYVVYLVESAESREALAQLGPADGEQILVVGTPEELAAAQAHIALLEMNTSMAPDPREVKVVDRRQSSVTHASYSSALVGTAGR